MNNQCFASITSDIDSLHTLFKGHGLRAGQYDYADVAQGLENFTLFLDRFGVKSTLFFVGKDLEANGVAGYVRECGDSGHEIANHSYSHPQGFRYLSITDKDAEIAKMTEYCEQLTGYRPIGFRAPGWNISDDTIAPLKKHGYLYDSSVHPTFLTPMLKFLHYRSTEGRSADERTTLGQMNYIFSRRRVYKTTATNLMRCGEDGIIEIPLTVTKYLRFPFWATFLLASGFKFFEKTLKRLRSEKIDIQFQFHLADFVDYSRPEYESQLPRPADGVYIPRALTMKLKDKVELYAKALEAICRHYPVVTLENLARTRFPDATPSQTLPRP